MCPYFSSQGVRNALVNHDQIIKKFGVRTCQLACVVVPDGAVECVYSRGERRPRDQVYF